LIAGEDNGRREVGELPVEGVDVEAVAAAAVPEHPVGLVRVPPRQFHSQLRQVRPSIRVSESEGVKVCE
jgi:hypothetical protein